MSMSTEEYKALKPIGRFEEGDIIGGFTDDQIKEHLALGNIEAIKTDKPETKKEVKANG